MELLCFGEVSSNLLYWSELVLAFGNRVVFVPEARWSRGKGLTSLLTMTARPVFWLCGCGWRLSVGERKPCSARKPTTARSMPGCMCMTWVRSCPAPKIWNEWRRRWRERIFEGLQPYIADSPWAAGPVIDHAAREVWQLLEGPSALCYIDGTAFSKKGVKLVGMARQFNRRSGKADHC